MQRRASRTKTLLFLMGAAICALVLCALLTSCGSSDANDNGKKINTVKATAAGNTAQAHVRTEDERKAASPSLNDVKPQEQVVYLTFDDGPSTNTHRIIDILNSYGVKATWFVKGQSGNLGYVTDIWSAGNQVALHTDTHDYTAVYASVASYWGDVEACGAAVKGYLGFKPSLVRFPGGSHNSYNTAIANTIIAEYPGRGYHYFDWNVSSGDGANHSADEIASYVISNADGCHSCCVLMHDSAAKDTTVEALPAIIEWFIDNGFTFDVLLSDSFGYHF